MIKPFEVLVDIVVSFVAVTLKETVLPSTKSALLVIIYLQSEAGEPSHGGRVTSLLARRRDEHCLHFGFCS